MAVFEEGKAGGELSPLEWLAVKLVGKHAEDTRDEVAPGANQEVDILLRIQGKITVGADTSATLQEKPKLDNLIGHIIKRLTPADWDTIRQSILETAQANGGVLPGCEEGYAAKGEGLVKLLSKSKTQSRKGSTKGAFRVGQVDTKQLSTATVSSVQKFTRQILLDEVG